MKCAFNCFVLSTMIRRILVAFAMLAVFGNTPCIAIQKSLILITPSGGSLIITKKQRITWRSVGIQNRVRLLLLKNGEEMGVIARDLESPARSYEWVVGKYIGGTAPVGKGYKIRIEEQGGVFSDDSNISFEITGIPLASGKLRAPKTYDFQINDLYVNKRGQLTAWIQSNRYDYYGGLRFKLYRSSGLVKTEYVTKVVHLRSGQQDIVELGDIASIGVGLGALQIACKETFSVTILTDENIRELNKNNNRMAKDLSVWKTDPRILGRLEIVRENPEMPGTFNVVRIIQRGDTLTFDPHSSDRTIRLLPLIVTVRNCGYMDITSGRLKVRQEGSTTMLFKPCPLGADKRKQMKFDSLVFQRRTSSIILEYTWDEPGLRRSALQIFSFRLKVERPDPPWQ